MKTIRKSRPPSVSVYDVDNLGVRLHELRTQRGLTLGELAARSGVPISTISKIERNKLKPSFTNAIDLAMALGENLGFLVRKYRKAPKRRSIVRSASRNALRFPEMGVLLSDITGPFLPGILEARHAVIKAGAQSGHKFMQHPGEEVCHIISGSLDFEIASKNIRLSAGDTIHFDCSIPHRWHNKMRTDACVLSIFSDGLSF